MEPTSGQHDILTIYGWIAKRSFVDCSGRDQFDGCMAEGRPSLVDDVSYIIITG